MEYKKADTEVIAELKRICGDQYVFTDDEHLELYGQDHTEDLLYKAEVAVRPGNTSEIAEIMKLCNSKKIAVTPRGAGTGLSGGCLPVFGGVVIVMDFVFQEEVKKVGLFYPPDPASWGSCFLGGNLAHSSGGPRAVKYGTTRDYVLNMQVVLPDGEVIMTGADTLKYSTGYNLTHLMIGSEGTLGIITKIIFKLIPLPAHDNLMLVPFHSAEKACEAVSAVFRKGITPSAMEFMERDAIEWSIRYAGEVSFAIKPEWEALLLIEVDGNDKDVLYKECELIAEVMSNYDSDEILFADSAEQKNALWKIRRKVGEAVKSNSVYKEEDTVVKRAELPVLLRGVKEIGKKYGFTSVCYGHAGDGNLHVNIIKGEMSDHAWKEQLPLGIREIFVLCKSLGGTISGEHGIGLVQKSYMDVVLSAKHLDLFKGIKNTFDPNGILNPGKIF
jgi:glycolate oxidase